MTVSAAWMPLGFKPNWKQTNHASCRWRTGSSSASPCLAAHLAAAPGSSTAHAVSASGSNSTPSTSAKSLKAPPPSGQGPAVARVVTGEPSRVEPPASRHEPALAGLMLPAWAVPPSCEAARVRPMLPDQLRWLCARILEPLQTRRGRGQRT